MESTLDTTCIHPQLAQSMDWKRIYFIKIHFVNLSLSVSDSKTVALHYQKKCISPYALRILKQLGCLFVFLSFKWICIHLYFNTSEIFSFKNFYFSIHIPEQLTLKEYSQTVLPNKKSEHLLFLVWVLVFCLFEKRSGVPGWLVSWASDSWF